MRVSVNTRAAKGLGAFLKNVGENTPFVTKKVTKNVLKNHESALEFRLKAALSSLPEMIIFHHVGKKLYLRENV